MAVSQNQVEFECGLVDKPPKYLQIEYLFGFGCEFMDEPPKCLQTECPICLQILREPYQVTCCGKSFCRQCIERIKADHAPCPCCKQDNFNDFPNKGLQQPLYGFKVYCANKQYGCKWTGELGHLDNHLNTNPQSGDKQLDGCDFTEIKCKYCSKFFVRIALLNHKEKRDKRPFNCEYCKHYESTYEDVTQNHWHACAYHPVQCPNNCGTVLQQQNLESHTQNECPLSVVKCEFHYAGCEIKLPRRNMPDHLKGDLSTHFSLLVVSHKQQQDDIKEMKALNDRQQDEIKALIEEVNQLKLKMGQVKLDTGIVPVELKMKKPLELFGLLSERTSSTPFYSHSQGYKLRIDICNETWTGAYYIRAYLMQGEFDDFLKWPLNAIIIMQVLSRQSKDLEKRIFLRDKNRVGSGDTETYSRSDIGRDLTPYLHNNYVHIRVISVQLI